MPEESFEADILAAAIKALLETTNWTELQHLVQEKRHILLSDQAVALLRKQVAEAEETTSDGRSEFLRMYLDLLENARSEGIEPACQRFTSDLLKAAEALQRLQMVHSSDEVGQAMLDQPEVYLATPVLAVMYSAIEKYRAGNNPTVVAILEQMMQYLMGIKQGKIIVDQASQKTQREEQQSDSDTTASQRTGYSFLPGIVQGFDFNDPYFMLLMQEVTKLTHEQAYALMPFITQMNTILQNQGGPGMSEMATRFLERIDRETTPYLWATLHYSRAVGYMDHPHEDNKQALEDCNDALAVFTRDITPQMWAHTRLLRAVARVNPIINEQTHNSAGAEQKQQLEQLLADFDATLSIFTREKMPLHWAMAIGTRGFAYVERERISGNMVQNIAQAHADFDAALSVLSLQGTPRQRATMYLYRGIMHFRLTTGDRKQNIELAIADCNAAISILLLRIPQEEAEQRAAVLMVRGLAYTERSEGERRQNIELALADFDAALTVYSRTHLPQQWARTLLNRGNVYMQRIEGNRRQNLEDALTDYNNALLVFTREEIPLEWGQTLTNRAICYQHRIAGERGKNQEHALADLTDALSSLTAEYMRVQRGAALVSRGSLYLLRIAGDRRQNYEHALEDFNDALTIYKRDETPLLWAKTLVNRGMAHRTLAISMSLLYRGFSLRTFADRLLGQHQMPIQTILADGAKRFDTALADLDAALTVLTRESTPYDWAIAMRERAMTYAFDLQGYFAGEKEQRLLQAIADFGAALMVFTPGDAPLEWATTLINRAVLYRERVRDRHLEDADRVLADTEDAMQVFTREIAPANYRRIQDIRASVFEMLERWEEAHNALLAARKVQRDLVAVTTSDSNRSDIVAEFALVDTYVRDARAMLQLPQQPLTEVAIALEEGRAQALRAALDLDIIQPQHLPNPAAQARAKNFLAARNEWRKRQHLMLEPVASLEERRSRELDLKRAYEAFVATRDKIRQHDNPDLMTPVPTLEGIARAVRGPGEALIYLVAGSSIYEAQGMAIVVMRDAAGNTRVQHIPLPDFKEISIFDLLEIEESSYPRIREKEAIARLGQLGLNELAGALYKEGILRVTFVAYGWLGLFPLPAVFVSDRQGAKRPWGEIFEVTFAPSARAAEIAYERARAPRLQRPLLLLAGNPQPLPRGIDSLPFAAAEADTARRIAKEHGYSSNHICYLHSRETTKNKVTKALQEAWYAHLAVHGQYCIDNPRRSRLILAGTEAFAQEERTIYLWEALDGIISLSGLRLLVLSACETAIIDTQRTPDEVLGLAAGFLQAGVAGVIASLWAVDDHATYLLMSRFAQLYLDPQGLWSPARALAEAQRWLREEATYSVLAIYDPGLSDRITVAQHKAATYAAPVKAQSHQGKEAAFSDRRTLRLTHKHALHEIHTLSTLHAIETPDALPYKDPEFWAAFIITGC